MSFSAARPTQRASRLPKVASSVMMLAVIGVLCATSGGLLRGQKVVLGRIWPSGQRLPLDQVPHDAWDELLRRYVDESGQVDYSAWRASAADVAALDEYLAQLSRGDPARDTRRVAQLAFWINAYNALTIRGILREPPVASIQDHVSNLGGYNIWSDLLLIVGDDAFSLGQIEHQILRPLRDPRIHFAIVCGSKGCPRLRQNAYGASDLDGQLDDNARDFFADPHKLDFDATTGALHLSPILKWYAEDFGESPVDVLRAITPYLPDETAARLNNPASVRVKYLEYNWSLNEQSTPPVPPPATGDSATNGGDAPAQDPN